MYHETWFRECKAAWYPLGKIWGTRSDAEEDSRSLVGQHVVSYVGATFLEELSASITSVGQVLLASLPVWKSSAMWKSAHQILVPIHESAVSIFQTVQEFCHLPLSSVYVKKMQLN